MHRALVGLAVVAFACASPVGSATSAVERLVGVDILGDILDAKEDIGHVLCVDVESEPPITLGRCSQER